MASQKQQKSISSFFAKASAPGSAPKKQAPGAVARKDSHPLSDDDEVVKPAAKRPRRSTPTGDSNGVQENRRLVPISPNKGDKQPKDVRTSKYLYSSSLQQENIAEPLSQADIQTREKLHEKFVKKLGKPDSIAEIKRKNRVLAEDEGEDDDEEADAPKGKKGAATKKAKLTPMEKQVIDIKKAHMDTVLVVEVGYKFRFFGEDARVAAKELSIVCIPGKMRYDEHASEAHLDRFASASIPVHRLHVHVKRLVAAGHKVGVVRQLETAALKAAGDNRNAPFVRKLTNLYTKGTYIDEVEAFDEPATATAAASTGFLLCLTEGTVNAGSDEKVAVGMVAVQPATGEIIYDNFEDGFLRSEIETRLLHLAPSELLVVGDVSKATDKLIQHLSGSKTNVFGDKIRVERQPLHGEAAKALGLLTSFYSKSAESNAGSSAGSNSDSLVRGVIDLPEKVQVCLSEMIRHLTEYGLEHVLSLTKYFQPFSARSHMLLNANTLSSLEIYQNQTDQTLTGSLLWTLDRTSTKFGQRLLRRWVGRPLLDQDRLNERLEAVEELLDPENSGKVEQLKTLLTKTRIDLEKSLIRIYYGKCTRPELVNVLQALQVLASSFGHVTTPESTGFTSSLITSAIVSLPPILTEVVHFLDQINLSAARDDDKYRFFREEEENDAISEQKCGIAAVEHELDEFRTVAAEKLGRKVPVEYVTVAGIEYLIELSNSSSLIKKVPASWIKVSGTKANARFHPPDVVKLVRERDQHKEALAAACDTAFKALLADISTKYTLFRDCIASLATLDCLLSLATVARQPGYTRPTFHGEPGISLVGARHPMIEQLLLTPYVPNPLTLSPTSTHALLLTGPNMGGKSSFVRSIALIAIMAQVGSYVPCDSASLGLFDSIHTRMGAQDNMLAGASTFMLELAETATILREAGPRSLVVLDELGRGTSTHDGVAIAHAVLNDLLARSVFTLFVTHYLTLARLADDPTNGLRNVHMRFAEEPAKTDGADADITFLYEVAEGTAHRSYGLNVARLANLPERVVRVAREKSGELEMGMMGRRVAGVAGLVGALVGGKGGEAGKEEGRNGEVEVEKMLEGVVLGIEQL